MSNASETPDSTVDLAIFKVGSVACALPGSDVQEIIKIQHHTPVPLAPGYVTGVINLRGHIVTLISLHKKFKIPQRRPPEQMRVFIVRSGEERVGLLADAVEDIVQARRRDIERAPPTLRGLRAQFLSGVYKMPGCLVAVLNLEEILRREE